MEIFLGGTCADSTWRDELIKKLNPGIRYFNPVVPDWNEESFLMEENKKKTCEYLLFVITPESENTYSVFEIAKYMFTCPERLIICTLDSANGKSFSPHIVKAYNKIKEEAVSMGIPCFDSLEKLCDFINQKG